MNSETKDMETDQWLSTYGLITIERVLGRYHIKLPPEQLTEVIRKQFSFYHEILNVPLKNVLNGIVIQQAHDYYVYAQKLYIDYLLSSEAASTEESPGATIRESLEEERKQLIDFGEEFHELELRQDALIAKSQAHLIALTQEWKTELDKTIQTMHKTLKKSGFNSSMALTKQAIEHVLIHCDFKSPQGEVKQSDVANKLNEVLNLSLNSEIKEKLFQDLSPLIAFSTHRDETLSDFYSQTKGINESARSFRKLMYDAILKVIDLLKLLPVYRIDPAQDQINKEVLFFDKTIGESES